MKRSLQPVRLLPLALLAACLAVTAAAPTGAGELSANLKQALVSAGPDDLVPAVVLMEEFPERDALQAEVRDLNRAHRRAHVVSTMKQLAGRSQRRVQELLTEEQDEIGRARVLWGINGVAVEATPRVIERLAALPEVRWVFHDDGGGQPADGADGTAWLQQANPSSMAGQLLGTGPTGGDVSGPNPEATVAGEVIAMGAKQVWDDLGYTGAGVIVAVIDTGVDRTHPDLADHIWTNLDEIADNGIDDDANGYVDDTWGWDFCGPDNDPDDTGSHGTQAAGQVAGDGTNGTVTGMAPDAEIMVISISCGVPDSIAWESSDYAIENGADIISMSFVWTWFWQPDYEAFRRQSDTELAAGVIRANAAGNDGDDPLMPIPYNVAAPANSPPPWLHTDQTLIGAVSSTLAVANIDWFSDTIASHSSRGPSAWEDIRVHSDPDYPWPMAPEYQDYPYANGASMGLLKPDIAAYGQGTTTTCPGPSYCQFGGTSSATPHVSGALALMLQANAEATPAELAEAILTTAEHRGDPGKNNTYGTGLLQAYPATLMVESGVLYHSHVIDDGDAGNGDLMLDPGERVTMQITVESRTDAAVDGLEAILSTTTPGVTIHNQHATYPTVPARGLAASDAPHYSLSIDPGSCTTVITFDLEVRYEGKVRRSTFFVRVGEEEAVTLLDDDFESDLGWTSDPGVSTQGAWVREDPIGVLDGQARLANPEDDTSDSGVTCWVTGNGELTGKKDENNNDVDGGEVFLLSPPFGLSHMLSLNLTFDRWFYDVESGNSIRAEISNDGGFNWTVLENLIYGAGGWTPLAFDLFATIPPTDDMRLRFVVEDDFVDDPVEGAIDEVLVEGIWVNCQDYTPPAALAPNPVGETLRVAADSRGHAVLTWDAPPVDAGHDAATIYRIERAVSPGGPFEEAGSATIPRWIDVDALVNAEPYHYRVRAENAGGGE